MQKSIPIFWQSKNPASRMAARFLYGAPSGTRIVNFSFGSFLQLFANRGIMRFSKLRLSVAYCNFSYLFIPIKDK